jgi:5-methylcytosine-specific restriction protein A
MPSKPPTCCPCGGLKRNGVCDRCGPAKRDYQAYDQHRGTRQERGYDQAWIDFRSCYLAEHPLCVDCEELGIVTPAREVHHKAKLRDRPDLKYEESNLAGLCTPCHSRRTARGE